MASSYGSILPAAWSFMLAARARGLGAAWTTAHLAFEKEAAELLGIPYERVTQVALLPTAFFTGENSGRHCGARSRRCCTSTAGRHRWLAHLHV